MLQEPHIICKFIRALPDGREGVQDPAVHLAGIGLSAYLKAFVKAERRGDHPVHLIDFSFIAVEKLHKARFGAGGAAAAEKSDIVQRKVQLVQIGRQILYPERRPFSDGDELRGLIMGIAERRQRFVFFGKIAEIREPWAKGEIITPKEYIGPILELIVGKRGIQKNISYIDTRAVIDFEAPMANLLTDFYDQLKSATSGYASFNYELGGYYAEDLVRVDFLVAGERVDALSVMAHRSEADGIGRTVTKKLKEVIPRQNFEVALQAAIGARIIARETLGAFRKDVTVKIHTGDRDRKAKLMEKQKRGKARMKRFGKVDIPSEAFTVMLKRD